MVFRAVPELQERDRLKHVGRRGEVQTVKVVRNGEGGPKQVWKPATRNPNHRGSLRRTAVHGRSARDRHAGSSTPPSTTTDSSAVGQEVAALPSIDLGRDSTFGWVARCLGFVREADHRYGFREVNSPS
jgi:hypothetical protein